MNRGDIFVCATLHGNDEQCQACLESLLAHTDAGVRIVVGGAIARRRGDPGLRALGDRRIELAADPRLERTIAATAPADVVLISAPCLVGAGWLEGLRDAAYSDSTVASAGALPVRDVLSSALATGAEPPPLDFESASDAVRAHSLRIRPRMEAILQPCTYIRRAALELVGDVRAGPDGRLAEFARTCLGTGLCHVMADEVLVLELDERPGRSEGPLRGARGRAVGAARRAVLGLSVLVDARIDADRTPGTVVHVIELVAALARSRRARVRALVLPDAGDPVRAKLERVAGVQLTVLAPPAAGSPAVADVLHRPFQLSTPADLAALAEYADRLVVTHLDLISFHNPSYFETAEEFEGYRSFTRRALAAADRVLFFTAHGRDDALAEELVEPHRASVVHIGVDHTITRPEPAPVKPVHADRLPEDREVMLCLGTDFRHKNRLFALRIAEELQRRHRWPGWLVLAGPRVSRGSSALEERELLESHPRLAAAVLDLGAVSEAEKAWLLARSDLVLYPTVHEGFGLIPFEAADHELPCLWAKGTSLSEVLPDEAAGIIAWNAATSADRALELMRDPDARMRNIRAIREAGSRLKWSATADRLIELYHRTCDELPATAAALERDGGLMRGGFSEDAVRLVGPRGALAPDLERPLLALATHPRVGGPLLGAIKAGYRASRLAQKPTLMERPVVRLRSAILRRIRSSR